eukprot:6212222-Pyramimonas_sp.AAC.1
MARSRTAGCWRRFSSCTTSRSSGGDLAMLCSWGFPSSSCRSPRAGSGCTRGRSSSSAAGGRR